MTGTEAIRETYQRRAAGTITSWRYDWSCAGVVAIDALVCPQTYGTDRVHVECASVESVHVALVWRLDEMHLEKGRPA